LHAAAWVGSTEAIELLIARGANLHARRRDGLTPLLEARGSGHTKAAELLRDRGAKE
jgi:uncharacterized protein